MVCLFVSTKSPLNSYATLSKDASNLTVIYNVRTAANKYESPPHFNFLDTLKHLTSLNMGTV